MVCKLKSQVKFVRFQLEKPGFLVLNPAKEKYPKQLRYLSWSGIPESDRCLHLGRVSYYHYTNPA